MAVLRVAVVGAGAAGLCAARHLGNDARFHCDVFEQTGDVGGTWVYTEVTHKDEYGLPVHSSMYCNLHTNIPKEIMGFMDFPFPPSSKSFVHHSEVHKYLKNYAEFYDLYKHIQFHTLVRRVSPEPCPDFRDVHTKWRITVSRLEDGQEEHHAYDAVIVCNGHYSVESVPDIPGVETFRGMVLHSHVYRTPNIFQDKTIALLGASSSGLDIAIELAPFAFQIYLSHNLPQPIRSKLPDNVVQLPGIQSASERSLIFLDGSTRQVDVLIYCTGYEFNFPFLSPECALVHEDRRLLPLYKHLIHIDFPTMAFVGIPFQVVPFPLFDHQIKYFLRTLDQRVTLPDKKTMLQEAESDFQQRLSMNIPARHAHKMGSLQWDYLKDLADNGGFQTLPPVHKKVYDLVVERRQNDLLHYKKDFYLLTGPDEYKILRNEEK